MATIRAEKIVSSLPATLEPNTVYFVRVYGGYDQYVTDSTGATAHPMNEPPSQRHFGESITLAGGTDWWGPPDPFTLSYNSASAYTVTSNRINYASMYVPRPLLCVGAFTSVSRAPVNDATAQFRSGIYRFGAPAGNSWDVGDLVCDFGVHDATTASNLISDLATPVELDRGWYVTAFGFASSAAVTDDRAQARYSRWMIPGMNRVYPYGTGTDVRPRVSGPSYIMYENNQDDSIRNGLPTSPLNAPVTDATSTNHFGIQCVYPKWREI